MLTPRQCGWLALLFVMMPLAAVSGAEKAVVNGSPVIREWCEKKSHHFFRKQKLTPYNWSASWWDEGNFIVVTGEWRVDGRRVVVHCRGERGRTLSAAVMDVVYE